MLLIVTIFLNFKIYIKITMSKKVLKQAALQTAAGGSAGFTEVCIMHPLDLIKTRLQIQTVKPNANPNDPTYYTGIVDCVKKMYKHEGLGSFWKGIIPPIMAETPKRALKFVSFEQYKRLLMFDGKATPLTFVMAGTLCGITEAFVANPFEVVKVTLQASRGSGKETKGTWATTKEIVKQHGLGLKGLNKGLSATIWRHGLFNLFYFGIYNNLKAVLPPAKDPTGEFLKTVGCGFISGVIGSIANIPFDVAKSRIQGPQPVPGQVKYKSLFGTLAIVYKEEGFGALYKGLLPKVLRLGPGGAIMIVVFDKVYGYLTVTFPD
ncbi:hypothetical protein PPYR_07072 [Photinus pyralis]|uniref:Mitochondrial 2-oxodicarboxylate carrier n=1 Tax=Photinus pyralis TaxID=7054 RepID=A0A1Y1MT59_PHOPY|nr:mitochondrial 2-oxodicarboxylate carrier-like [Photinus pyralis]KAB0799192.1 hypothetical protein PPYR_07072 [Photinus pyralis]